MLHIVKHSRHLSEVLNYALADDCILLVEDAVYAVLSDHKNHLLILNTPQAFYCLTADAKARGVIIPPKGDVKAADFSDFVDLTAQYSRSITWE